VTKVAERKASVADLAAFGGRPAFPADVHVGYPDLGDRRRFLSRVGEILDRRWLTNDGPCVREFERTLAERVGVRHVVATANGTLALELVFRALDLRGDVLVPSFTFIATAHALRMQGLRPVFCDVARHTHCLDPDEVARRLTPRTTGILATHLWGELCEIHALEAIAKRHDLRLIFDAAHAFGCSSADGRMAGSFGDAEVFSFHATKILNTAEGGAVATNNDDLAARLRRMRNFGFTGYDAVDSLGTNAKMSEFAAALGLTNLESVDGWMARNRQQHSLYRSLLRDVPALELFPVSDVSRRNCQYVVTLVSPSAGLERDELVELLHAEHVLARRYFSPGCHRMMPYRDDLDPATALSITDDLARRVLVLPTGASVSADDIGRIVNLLRFVLAHTEEVRDFFAKRPGLSAGGEVR